MLRSLTHVPNTNSRVALIDEHVRRDSAAAVNELHELLSSAHEGDRHAREICIPLAVWRARLHDEEQIHALRTASSSTPSVAPLFGDQPARLVVPPHSRLEPGVARRRVLPSFRHLRTHRWVDDEGVTHPYAEMPSQHRREVALQLTPKMVQGLEEGTLIRLLDEPLLDEPTVIALATHRPSTLESLRVLVCHAHWMSFDSIRRAVVCNPYAPPWLTHALVPTLARETAGWATRAKIE